MKTMRRKNEGRRSKEVRRYRSDYEEEYRDKVVKK